jgi:hypothetical protein
LLHVTERWGEKRVKIRAGRQAGRQGIRAARSVDVERTVTLLRALYKSDDVVGQM